MKKIFRTWIVLLSIFMCTVTAHASELSILKISNNSLIQPYFTNIILYQNSFDILSSGKVTVSSYLTAQNVDKVNVTSSLQQLKSGKWENIETWSRTTTGTHSSLSGEKYVLSGFSYRVVSTGTTYRNGVLIEKTTNISVSKSY